MNTACILTTLLLDDFSLQIGEGQDICQDQDDYLYKNDW